MLMSAITVNDTDTESRVIHTEINIPSQSYCKFFSRELKDYQRLGTLGTGSFGNVEDAIYTHRKTKQKYAVAMKKMSFGKHVNENLKRHRRNEIDIHLCLTHGIYYYESLSSS